MAELIWLPVSFIGPDERAGARRVGEALAHRLNSGDKVAIIAEPREVK